ncbi:hypothetical protein [Spirillospora sp. NPDC047279]|uniref:hypothetical protein n=1 Tax=Spirillospora sp. NPDC047279 TaxID=3155478 RepID=UPI00340563B1
MALAYITLASGRDVELTRLKVCSTYEGLLEGYPTVSMNDRLLASLARRRAFTYRTAPPVHVIEPPRARPDPGSRRLPFGPMETLPPVYCVGFFESFRVNEDLDEVLHRSWLDVAWFQDDLAGPVAGFVAAAVAGLHWERLAEDYEV